MALEQLKNAIASIFRRRQDEEESRRLVKQKTLANYGRMIMGAAQSGQISESTTATIISVAETINRSLEDVQADVETAEEVAHLLEEIDRGPTPDAYRKAKAIARGTSQTRRKRAIDFVRQQESEYLGKREAAKKTTPPASRAKMEMLAEDRDIAVRNFHDSLDREERRNTVTFREMFEALQVSETNKQRVTALLVGREFLQSPKIMARIEPLPEFVPGRSPGGNPIGKPAERDDVPQTIEDPLSAGRSDIQDIVYAANSRPETMAAVEETRSRLAAVPTSSMTSGEPLSAARMETIRDANEKRQTEEAKAEYNRLKAAPSTIAAGATPA